MALIDPGQAAAVQGYYKKYLGRDAAASDPENWLTGQFGYGTDLGSIEQGIAGSDEAKQYAARQSQVQPLPQSPYRPPPASRGQPQAAPGGMTDYFPTYPAPPQPLTPPTPTSTYDPASIKAVQDWYQQYLGRQADTNDPMSWLSGAYGWGNASNLPGIQSGIQNSPEAKAYAARPGQSSGDPLYDAILQNYQSLGKTPTGPGSGATDIQYFLQRMQQTGGLTDQNKAYWLGPQGRIAQELAGTVPPETGGANYGGTSVFNDPATAQFEQLLNKLISGFTTPQTPPGYQQAVDQLNAYLTKLNGPAYTPDQMDLLQTQATDPLQQQHDAAQQQLIARLGAQGISPSSGIFQKALEDLNRQFAQARTSLQANFASNAVGLDRQNAALAAQLAPQISNFQQAQTQWQDSRNLQGEMLAALIPQMAQQRLQAANGSVQQMNPLAIMQLINQMQQQGYNQGGDFGNMLAQILAQLFGM